MTIVISILLTLLFHLYCIGVDLVQVGGTRLLQGYYLRALKMMNVPKELAEEHYVDLASKPFYPGLVNYIVR